MRAMDDDLTKPSAQVYSCRTGQGAEVDAAAWNGLTAETPCGLVSQRRDCDRTMPRKIPVEELDRIVALVKPHANGVGVDKIRGGLEPGFSARTLQRRLGRLAAEGRIVARGTTRGKRYFPAEGTSPADTALPGVDTGSRTAIRSNAQEASLPVEHRSKTIASDVQNVSERGVMNLVRGRSDGPCIALLLDRDLLSVRQELVGMMRQLGWQILDLRYFGRALPSGYVPDGVFTDLDPTDPKVKVLQGLGFPIIRLSVWPTASESLLPTVAEDRDAAGRMAAEHFAERRFRHFGFVGFGEMDENRTMYEAMRSRASELGCEFHLHRHRALTHEERQLATNERRRLRRVDLAQWLLEVPKPIGMLAWSDHLGGRICAAANQAGLNIPSDVAVLGYGNRECDCECTLVPLSSIDPGVVRHADVGVRLMQALLAGESPPGHPIEVPPVGIEVRESTDALAVVDPLVVRALRYMWNHIDRDLGSEAIASAMGTSRRTLERAFRRHLGSSIRSELLRRRIDQLKLLLQTTDRPIADLSSLVGFNSAQYMSNAFRRTVSMAPKQYRRVSREQGDDQLGFWRSLAQSD